MAAEHVLHDVLRRAAPYALDGIVAELERAEKAVERTSAAFRALPSDATRARVSGARKRWEKACEAQARLLRLRDDLKEAVRDGGE